MLTPNRFTNLKFSLLNTTALVIDYLLQENKATTKELLTHLNNFSKEFDREDIVKSVTFLYALGKVDYSEKSDRITLSSQASRKEAASA